MRTTEASIDQVIAYKLKKRSLENKINGATPV